MDSIVTLFPNERGVHDVALMGERMPSMTFNFGNSYVSLHTQSPETCRQFAADILAAVERWEAAKLASDDAANRTPDANLDRTEREDQPEEVAANALLNSL